MAEDQDLESIFNRQFSDPIMLGKAQINKGFSEINIKNF
jgi:hypothetical protein